MKAASSIACPTLLGASAAHANLLSNGSFEFAGPGYAQPPASGALLEPTHYHGELAS